MPCTCSVLYMYLGWFLLVSGFIVHVHVHVTCSHIPYTCSLCKIHVSYTDSTCTIWYDLVHNSYNLLFFYAENC